MKKINLLFHTIKYLKLIQVFYRFYYIIRPNLAIKKKEEQSLVVCLELVFINLPSHCRSFSEQERIGFNFLNNSHIFENQIDWNYPKFGKLWTYNLTYFDFLCQERMSMTNGIELIHDFIFKQDTVKDGLEPFPISLRSVNWIKFLSKHAINDKIINDSLSFQYNILQNNIEYHLLGNHLLENGFSLLFGAYYFKDEKLYDKANKILKTELKEQILNDGGHFELSPMYHQIMLLRVLDCINLVKHNDFKNQELLVFLESNAKRMLIWLNTMTFKNGNIPLFNDSANHIAPTTQQLNTYAIKLNLETPLNAEKYQLDDSGYRKHVENRYELVMDVGNIGPDYIPGHAHADTFNFELYIDGQPFIVDTGISTYEKNELRQFERSTESHNTVTVNGENQSQVWGGFRVGKRAKIIELQENGNEIIASHNGYKKMGVIHKRRFKSSKEKIEIKDTLIGNNDIGKAYFHFHPSITNLILKDNLISFIDLGYCINFRCESMKIEKKMFNHASAFNVTEKAIVLVVTFEKELVTNILLET